MPGPLSNTRHEAYAQGLAKPAHGDPASPEVRKGKLLPWRAAAVCIDWSLPCPSIFDTGPEIMIPWRVWRAG